MSIFCTLTKITKTILLFLFFNVVNYAYQINLKWLVCTYLITYLCLNVVECFYYKKCFELLKSAPDEYPHINLKRYN